MRKRIIVIRTRHSPDKMSYTGADSGCQAATHYLSRRSSCLDCPFFPAISAICILDMSSEERNKFLACLQRKKRPLAKGK